jgi:hypothetical protein
MILSHLNLDRRKLGDSPAPLCVRGGFSYVCGIAPCQSRAVHCILPYHPRFQTLNRVQLGRSLRRPRTLQRMPDRTCCREQGFHSQVASSRLHARYIGNFGQREARVLDSATLRASAWYQKLHGWDVKRDLSKSNPIQMLSLSGPLPTLSFLCFD